MHSGATRAGCNQATIVCSGVQGRLEPQRSITRIAYPISGRGNRMDVLGLYARKLCQRSRLVLGNGLEDNYQRVVLRAHLSSDLEISLQLYKPTARVGFSAGWRTRV